jgi:type I restriction enzyme, S subunit
MSEFPAHWKVTPFRDLVTLKRGIDLPVQQRKEGEIPIYGSNGIVGFHSKASQDHPGIVTGRSGSIGNVYLHKKPFWALNTTLYSEQTHGNHIEYIYHFLKWFDLSRFSGGTGVPTLNRNDVHDQVIGIPPLPEQKKIAEILSGIDRHRELLIKKKAHASMLSNALGEKFFSSLDGEKIALGEICNPKQWQTISANQLTDSGYPVYGANGQIGHFTEYNHRDPVLAVTCRGATCGNLTLVPGFSYVTGNSMCLDNPRNDTTPEYLFHFLSWRGLKDVISGSAQPQITRSPLQAVEIVLPIKEKQNRIVSTLESVNSTNCSIKSALDRLDLLKQAISADLLSGRKRVCI